MKFNKLAELFPLLEGKELESLANDIKSNGLRNPITTYRGEILDGRNRYTACVIAKVKPTFVEFNGDNNKLLEFVISANLHRRHLNESQRAMIAGKVENTKHGGIRHGQNTIASQDANLHLEGHSRSEVAEMFNVSPRLVAEASRVREQADPKTIKEIESGNIAISKVARNLKRADKVEQITRGNKELDLDKLYQVLYADPPWEYDFSKSDSREIENQYPTMPVEEICNLPIDHVTANDCVLFLWATSPKLREALRVIDSWGFDYKTNAVWVKNKIGMGYYFRQRHELLLVATRGNLPTPKTENRFDSVIEAERTEHSKKPDRVYELIEKMYPEFDKCELFARNKHARSGWTFWGNEV